VIEVISRDTITLPNALLQRVKAQIRVNHCEDDLLIQDMIAAVIEIMEAQDDCSIFAASYLWTPDVLEFGSTGDLALVPVSPVGAWTADADNPALPPPDRIDVTANFSISTNAVFGAAQYYLRGIYMPALALTIASGFTAATLPAAKRLDIGKGVSTAYEYRDILTPSNLSVMPGWLADRICGQWRPRV
jgi:hypothetical protein